MVTSVGGSVVDERGQAMGWAKSSQTERSRGCRLHVHRPGSLPVPQDSERKDPNEVSEVSGDSVIVPCLHSA